MELEEQAKYHELTYMQSRIPALDALSIFVPTGMEEDPELQKVIASTGFCRWYPVEGGHEVLILYEGGEYNSAKYQIKKHAWDHEHCKICGTNIPAMTLCWVTKSGPYIILCADCYNKLDMASPS